MNDNITLPRELLELAAKAAGYEVEVDHKGVVHIHEGTGPQSWRPWNPRDDDGDALRLAVKLKMELIVHERLSCAAADGLDGFLRRSEHHKGDPDAATRRAIVRAAAEIGRNMK